MPLGIKASITTSRETLDRTSRATGFSHRRYPRITLRQNTTVGPASHTATEGLSVHRLTLGRTSTPRKPRGPGDEARGTCPAAENGPSQGDAPEVEEVEALENELEHGRQVLRRRGRHEDVAVPVGDRAREAQPDRRRFASTPSNQTATESNHEQSTKIR